jgi:hypothetical protein
VDVVDLAMVAVDATYPLAPGKVYNVEASEFIREGGDCRARTAISLAPKSPTWCGRAALR